MLDNRLSRRFAVSCRGLFYGPDDFEGEGITNNLSVGGCCVESGYPVEVGMELRLALSIGDFGWPLSVDGAVVRWKRERLFGVEFCRVRPPQQQRLRSFLHGLLKAGHQPLPESPHTESSLPKPSHGVS